MDFLFKICLIVYYYNTLTNALYFYIHKTETRCFYEEFPENEIVLIDYKIEEFVIDKEVTDEIKDLGVYIEVQDENSNIVLRKGYGPEGKVSFATQRPGSHIICIRVNGTNSTGENQLRLHFSIKSGSEAFDFAQLVEQEKLSEVQLRMKQLLKQVDSITKEQNYQRFRESRFRNLSDTTHQRVMGWSIIQLIALIFTGFCQIMHLKRFFREKKLV